MAPFCMLHAGFPASQFTSCAACHAHMLLYLLCAFDIVIMLAFGARCPTDTAPASIERAKHCLYCFNHSSTLRESGTG